MDIELDDIQDLDTQLLEEVDHTCLRLYADMLEHNSTQAAVTTSLQTWLQSVGHRLPDKMRDAMPQTYEQLLSRFQKQLAKLIRIPACPGDCSLLEDVIPTTRYVCECDGKENVAWKRTKGGKLVPLREFITVSFSEVIRSWYVKLYVDVLPYVTLL